MSPLTEVNRKFDEIQEDELPSVRRVIDADDLTELSNVPEGIADEIRTKILWGVYGDYGALNKIVELRDVERLSDSFADAEAFQQLYLGGLLEQPSSFGSTYKIESVKSFETVQQFIRDNYVVGVKYSYSSNDGEPKEKLVAVAVLNREVGVQSHIAHIGKVCVHPAHRKKGLAKNMMDHLLEYAAQNQIEQLHLIVTASNEFVVKFYERMGFVPGEIQHKAVKIEGQYYDWLPMKLSVRRGKSEKLKSAPNATG